MKKEKIFFIRKLLKNPKSVGAIAPSSKSLAAFVAQCIQSHEVIVELGAGTGGLTKALLEVGLPSDRLVLLELDGDMCLLLRKKFPELLVIQGDASLLPELLEQYAPHIHSVDAIVSGIPMVNLSKKEQSSIVEACFRVLSPQGRFLQFTYGPLSPLPHKKMGLVAERLGHVLKNVPPAVIWQYTKPPALFAAALENNECAVMELESC